MQFNIENKVIIAIKYLQINQISALNNTYGFEMLLNKWIKPKYDISKIICVFLFFKSITVTLPACYFLNDTDIKSWCFFLYFRMNSLRKAEVKS